MASFKGFGKRLASTEESIRLEALKELKDQLRTADLQFSDCMKLWKALFYCKLHPGMWMCDGKDNQTALATDLVSILDIIPAPWQWSASFFELLRLEWDTLDRHRFDKYMHLVRVYLHRTMALVTKATEAQWLELILPFLEKSTYKGQALAFHIYDIFAEERPKKSVKATLRLLKPFLLYLKTVKLPHIAEAIFTRILSRFINKPKYRPKIQLQVQEILSDYQETESYKRPCGIQALFDCLENRKSEKKEEIVEEEVPDALKSVMNRFYTQEKNTKTPEKPQKSKKTPQKETITEEKTYEEITVPLGERKRKAKETKETTRKQRKVMFNLQMNTTQHFGKDEVVGKSRNSVGAVSPSKGVLRPKSQ